MLNAEAGKQYFLPDSGKFKHSPRVCAGPSEYETQTMARIPGEGDGRVVADPAAEVPGRSGEPGRRARFGETALAGEARTVSDDLAEIYDLAGRMVSTLASRWGKMPISVSICSSCRAAGSFLG